MMLKKKHDHSKRIFLTAVISVFFISFVLRFIQLGENPVSLTWDEASWGYNSYALSIDGRDEFGVFLPYQYLESFGDYKPPMYAYLGIIPVKLFGLTEFATRFPSALFGFLTVIVTFFLMRRIFHDSPYADWYALASAAVLAVSPWHINLSRAAFEANVATFFITTGVWLFLVGVQEKKWFLVLSAISFAASFYTFNTARIVVPILGIILVLGFYKTLLARWKATLVAAMVAVLLIAPLIGFLRSDQAALRFKEVNFFSDIEITERINQQIANDNNTVLSRILHHRYLTFSTEYLNHYFDHFNPRFLFISGDENTKFSTQDVGQMYLVESIFLIIGVLYLIRKREGHWWIVPMWLLIGIIPAATARETPHALRIESSLPMFQVLVAYGFVTFVLMMHTVISRRRILAGIWTTLGVVYGLSIIYYIHGYYVHYPREFSGNWQYGYKESIQYVTAHQYKYDRVFMTHQSLGRPYIYYLFYTRTDPKTFQRTADITRDVFGFVNVRGFGKYVFRDNHGQLEQKDRKTLYVNVPSDTPENAQLLKEFYLVDGYHILNAYEL